MIQVIVTPAADGTLHPKYGLLQSGAEISIDEADFGDEIFKKIDNAPQPPLTSRGGAKGSVKGKEE